jgi:PKD repeat protein
VLTIPPDAAGTAVLERGVAVGVGRRAGARPRRWWLAMAVAVLTGLLAPSIAAAAAPTASFTVSPPAPAPGQLVTFTSTSTVAEGDAPTFAWRLRGSGTLAGADQATATTTFATTGSRTVTLTVTDATGVSSQHSETVTVTDPAAPPPNQPPVATFTIDPPTISAGRIVTFVSTSTDPDGQVAAQAWDLNGDGVFDDGTGLTAAHVFGQPGSYLVALTATDDLGLSSTAFDTVQVSGAPATALGTATPVPAAAAPLRAPGVASGSTARRALQLSPNAACSRTAQSGCRSSACARTAAPESR